MTDDPAMDIITTERVRIVLDGRRLLIAPSARPGEYREVPVSQLDSWALKRLRELALQPPVEPPKEKA